MYTYEKTEIGTFIILDPDGTGLAVVKSLEEAEALLSHLNR